jgi:peptidoglycan biosynthesis protein MviN/MurJ (putative lipid II flippase)
MGYRGLALGTALTAIINASLQLLLLRHEIHGLHGARIAASLGRVLVASAVMGAVTWGSDRVMTSVMPGASLPTQAIRLLATISVSLAALVAAAQLLRIPEFAEAREMIVGRLKRMTG